MLLLKGDPAADPSTVGANPPEELIEAMGRFNEELAKAGVLIAAEGLHPSALGSRVVYARGARTVVDGPFAEAKELVAGYYLIQVPSKAEAIEWARRCPVHLAVQGDQEAVIEVRQVAEMEDLSNATEEQRDRQARLREQLGKA
jgi:hypothetical protein